MQVEYSQTLILNRQTLQSLLTMSDVNQAIEEAFLAYGKGHWEVPAKIIFSQDQYDGDFGAMPAYCHEPEYIAIKWGGVHNRNPQIGLPTTLTQIILSDPKTAWPLAIAEGAWITEMRTGAAAGIATKYMARPDAGVLAVIGAGAVGRRAAESISRVRSLASVRVASRTFASAQKYAAEMTEKLNVPVAAIETIQSAVQGADIVNIATPARAPLIMADWIEPGSHINAMGADSPGKQELDPRILAQSHIIVDHKSQARIYGEIHLPLQQQQLSETAVVGDIGEVVAGRAPGRQSNSDITVFDGTGMALEDAAVVYRAYHLACERGLGQVICLQ
ncbi:MAG: ornithine cyclodeaminase family protein [bacterium]|nr:ornithine cyclodeaminase family protein [bacterium]